MRFIEVRFKLYAVMKKPTVEELTDLLYRTAQKTIDPEGKTHMLYVFRDGAKAVIELLNRLNPEDETKS